MGGQVQTSMSISEWLLSPPLLREDLSSDGACHLDRPMLLCRLPGTCCASYIGTDLSSCKLNHGKKTTRWWYEVKEHPVPSFHTFTCSPLLVAVLLLSTIQFICLTGTQLLSWHAMLPNVKILTNLYWTVFVSTFVISLACTHTSLSLGILFLGNLG